MGASLKDKANQYDDEIRLGELIQALWEGKWVVGSVTVLFAVMAVTYALLLPNIYRAEALLAPNREEGAGGLAALAAQYGGLASLAGVSVNAGRGDKTDLAIETLQSRKFIVGFIERNDLLVPLIAGSGWDEKTSELIIDQEVYDSSLSEWVRDVGWPKQTVPSSQEAYKAFKDLLSISEDKRTGFIHVSIEHYSPHVAKQWVDKLVEAINAEIMNRDVAEAERAIDYLQQQVQSTSLSELRAVFFRLIEEQSKTVMLANVSPEYVFRTIDPAIAPELKASPKRAAIAIVGTILGGLIGLLLLLVRNIVRTERTG
ncbi:MAG: Wzz/FepE/Etk N-terminal domain-containing protein [Woeseia sp.]